MLSFERGKKYTRPDVKAQAGLSRNAKGGSWDTGVLEHENEFIIFTNVGTEGRTGHNYGNRWEGNLLQWFHKAGSHLGWPSIQKLLEPNSTVHVFWRTSNAAAFDYAGNGSPVDVFDTSPVQILWSFDAFSVAEPELHIQSPEQVDRGEYREGAVRQVLVNAYERNRAARQACIDHYGLACAVCDLQLKDRYGPLGAGFIHVHHIVPMSELGANYRLDPVRDLRPVCPNCHSILHRQRPPLSIEKLRCIMH